MIRYFSILYPVLGFVVFLQGCSAPFLNKGMTHTEIVEIIYPENSEISIKNIPQGILYYAPSHPEASLSNGIFIATGSGGRGIDSSAGAENNNTFIAFDGMSVQVSEWIPETKVDVKISAGGDARCQNLFIFDKDNLKIKIINSDQIDSLFECQLNVDVVATNPNNKSTAYHTSFPAVFNLAMSEYAKRKDPLVLALMEQAKVDDFNKLAVWLQSDVRAFDLDVSQSAHAKEITHVNALTGLVNLYTLNLANTALNSTDAFKFLNSLRILDLSRTHISNDELKKLSQFVHLSKLVLKDSSLTSLSFLDNNFSELDELDLSDNKLFYRLISGDLKILGRLKQLSAMNLSNTGLNDFSHLSALDNLASTLKILNISRNNLSNLVHADGNFFRGMNHLETLDVSESNISVSFLNSYFAALEVYGDSKLKHFIYRGQYKHGNTDSKENYCNSAKNGAFLLNVGSLKFLSTLETIDFHGQGCLDASLHEQGLTNTSIFQNVNNLVKLDISSTPVRNLEGLQNLSNLKKVVISSADGNISMSHEQCRLNQTNYIPDVEIDSCEKLLTYKLASATFTNPDQTYEFIVPENVWKIYVKGCSGANGGAGGGASGSRGIYNRERKYGLFHMFKESEIEYYVNHGGDSGIVNQQGDQKEYGIQAEHLSNNDFKWFVQPVSAVQHGGNGGLGEQTVIRISDGENLASFPLASSDILRDSNTACVAGENGFAGDRHTDKIGFFYGGNSETQQKFYGAAGARNPFSAWSSPIVSDMQILVMPKQKIWIKVGHGGVSGKGGSPTYLFEKEGKLITEKQGSVRYLGNPGGDGSAGSDGFVILEWESEPNL